MARDMRCDVFLSWRSATMHAIPFSMCSMPALRLVMVDSMQKDDREQYLQDERKDAARDLAAFLARTKMGRMEQILRHEVTTR